ncbi:hypothetical protein HDU97_008896, partial [Phlyctochytrium planicorne]
MALNIFIGTAMSILMMTQVRHVSADAASDVVRAINSLPPCVLYCANTSLDFLVTPTDPVGYCKNIQKIFGDGNNDVVKCVSSNNTCADQASNFAGFIDTVEPFCKELLRTGAAVSTNTAGDDEDSSTLPGTLSATGKATAVVTPSPSTTAATSPTTTPSGKPSAGERTEIPRNAMALGVAA